MVVMRQLFYEEGSNGSPQELHSRLHLYNPHDMKLLVTIAVYISRRRGGGHVAALQTYVPVASQTWSTFLPNMPNTPAFSNTPRGSSTPKTSRFLPPGVAAGAV